MSHHRSASMNGTKIDALNNEFSLREYDHFSDDRSSGTQPGQSATILSIISTEKGSGIVARHLGADQ
jgi:hypothetical protein